MICAQAAATMHNLGLDRVTRRAWAGPLDLELANTPGFARILRPKMVALNARRTALPYPYCHMPTGHICLGTAISAQKRPATLRGFSQAQRVRNSFLLRPTAATMGQPRCPVLGPRVSAFSQARRARARRFQSIPHHSVSHGSSTQASPGTLPTATSHHTADRRAPQPHATVQRRSQPSAPPAIRSPQSPDASPSPSADPDAATCRRSPFRRPPRPRSSPTSLRRRPRSRPRPTSPCPSTSRTRSTPHGQRGPQPRRRWRRCLRTTPSTPCPKSSRYIAICELHLTIRVSRAMFLVIYLGICGSKCGCGFADGGQSS